MSKKPILLDLEKSVDEKYLELIRQILTEGDTVVGRNATTIRLNGVMIKFSMTPLISARVTAYRNALKEFEWMLSGSNNINDLDQSVQHWWAPWADASGKIRSNYGIQFREFTGYVEGSESQELDQIEYLVNSIKKAPYSRRHVITTWNTTEMLAAPITNCHGTVIQASVDSKGRLSLLMVQRSGDVMVGLPHNFFQYYAFLLWLADQTNTTPGEFTWMGGDVHIYEQHIASAEKMLASKKKMPPTPKLIYAPKSKGIDFKASDFYLEGDYEPVLKLRLPLIV